MQAHRRIADVPGLASLLADAPRHRIVALCAAWDAGSPDQPGVGATLYRRMTDRERVAAVVAGLDDGERLILSRLAATPGGQTLSDLADRLPFSDEVIERHVKALAERGFVWEVAFRRADRGEAGGRWLVPRDLAPGLAGLPGSRRPPAKAPPIASPGPSPAPSLARVQVDPSRRRPGGGARDVLAALVASDARKGSDESAIERFARIAGIALGVLDRQRGVVGLGPRAASWSALSPLDQTRALTRLWLVDDKVAGSTSAILRQALANVLRVADGSAWYSVDSVARAVAARMAQIEPSATPPLDRFVKRDLVAQSIELLAWIGVVDVAIDSRDRPVALRLTTSGPAALN